MHIYLGVTRTAMGRSERTHYEKQWVVKTIRSRYHLLQLRPGAQRTNVQVCHVLACGH